MSVETFDQAQSIGKVKRKRGDGDSNPLNVILGRFGIVVALILLGILFSVHSQNALGRQVFLTQTNLIQIVLQAAINIVIAVGMTFVITTGGIDLSVGSIVALAGIAVASITKGIYAETAAPWIKQLLGNQPSIVVVAMLVGITVGAICGLINGLLITRVKLPPFIVTLGTMGIFRGATMIFSEGRPIYSLPGDYIQFYTGSIGPIPIPVIVALIVVAIFTFVLNRTRLGEYTIAIGGNEETARLSGIPVLRYKTLVYVLCGVLCGVAACLLTARLSAAEAIAGQNFELDAIAATVMGGTSLMGGEGTIFGTLIGGVLMSALRNGMNLFNVQVYWQQVIVGLVIIAAVTLDRLKKQS